MKEVELKILLDEDGEKRLRRQRALSQMRDGKASRARLLTVYFDAPDGRLGAAGIALRLRRKGRAWIQTIKGARALRGGLSSAVEAECPAPGGRVDLGAVPDEALRERLEALVDGAPLAPVFQSEIDRTLHNLVLEDGARVELAIDVGQIRAGELSRPFREAELELKEGEPAALFAAARALFPDGGIRFSTLTKADRGAMLAREGRITPDVAPRTARTPRFEPDMPAGDVVAEILSECLDQIASNAAFLLAADDPEGPHQLRVGLRRLRTALNVFRSLTDGAAARHLAEQAKWLGQEVGRLRDLDVTLAEIVTPAAERQPQEPGFAALVAALEARAVSEREALRTTLRGVRVQRFLLDLAEYTALRGWEAGEDAERMSALALPIGEIAPELIDRALSRAAKRAKKIDQLDIPARHELRMALKKLRYTVEFMAPLYKKKHIKAWLGPLRALQDLFGALNDAAMVEALFLAPGAPGLIDPAAARAAGRVIGARQVVAEHDWVNARKRWHALRKANPFWRGGK